MSNNDPKIRIIQEGQEIRGGINGGPNSPRPTSGPPPSSPKGANKGK